MRQIRNFSLTLCFLSSLFLSWSSLAIACGGFHHRKYGQQRACFANQKTLAGGIEMYSLDFNLDVLEITPQLLNELKTGGYLQTIPVDPGFGADSSSNYFIANTGLICCLNHGAVGLDLPNMNRSTPPYDQLVAMGETREKFLSKASRKNANALSAEDQLIYDIGMHSEVLVSLPFFISIFWFPLSIWRLRHFRWGQKYKLAALVMTYASFFYAGNHYWRTFYSGVVLLYVVLILDTLIFTVRVICSRAMIVKLINKAYSGFSRLSVVNLQKVKATFEKSTEDHQRTAKIMMIGAVASLLPAILWLFSRRGDVKTIVEYSIITAVLFIIGAVSGVVRFSHSIESADVNYDSDGTIPIARNIILALLFASPVYGFGRFAINTAIIAWPHAALPIISLAAVFGGRSLTVSTLNKRFVLLLHNLPYIELPTPIKKHFSKTGISAHPGRVTSSTIGRSGTGLSQTDEPIVPLPEARLSLAEATCPVCGEGFPDNEAWVCNDCNTPHHSDCWKFNSECTTFGCNSQKVSVCHM